MEKQAVTVNWGNTFLRVRKVDSGCLIFDSNGVMVEGNKTVWQIMVLLSGGSTLEQVNMALSRRYGLSPSIIEADVNQLVEKLERCGWRRDSN